MKQTSELGWMVLALAFALGVEAIDEAVAVVVHAVGAARFRAGRGLTARLVARGHHRRRSVALAAAEQCQRQHHPTEFACLLHSPSKSRRMRRLLEGE